MPLNNIANFLKQIDYLLSVWFKFQIKQASDIFQHNHFRMDFLCKTYSFRKQITLIILPQLFSSNRKRRTRYTTCQQIYFSTISSSVKIVQISPNDIPIGAILHECLAIIFFDFHKCNMLKSSLLQTKRLTTCTCTNF